MLLNRRKQKRYRSKEGTFAVLEPGTLIGQIIDISMGGLSFSYIDDKNIKSEPKELDIYTLSEDINIEKIPFSIITDCELEKKTYTNSFSIRKKSIKFEKLNFNMRSMLKYLINTHTKKRNP